MGRLRLEPLGSLGAIVRGLDLYAQPSSSQIVELEREAAHRGFLVFPNVSLSAEAFHKFSGFFGPVIGRHTVHPAARHEDVLLLSNVEQHGIRGVGPQWHNDGSFERRVFSHVAFHALRMPATGGGTEFSDLAAAYESLPARRKEEWARLSSVNAYSGSLHPIVHVHPISKKPVLFLHLAQTGAIVRRTSSSAAAACEAPEAWARLEAMAPGVGPTQGCHEALSDSELREFMGGLDALLSRREHRTVYTYSAAAGDMSAVTGTGDMVLVDNLAVAHRATPQAHSPEAGLRILQRTTMGARVLDPPPSSGLPPFAYIWGRNPLARGVWKPSDNLGVGFRWNVSLPMRN